MLIKNDTLAPITVQGVTLIPGQETLIPEGKEADVLRDLKGVQGVEEVKERAKPGPKAKDD